MTAESAEIAALRIREAGIAVQQFDRAIAKSKARVLKDIATNPTGPAAKALRERQERMARAEVAWGLPPGTGAEIFNLAAQLSEADDLDEMEE